MTTFFFVRHGVTAHTGHRLSGWMDIPLNEEGKAQAQAAADSLAGVRFKKICSSPVARCAETAEIVAAPHRKPVELLEDLGEVRYGDWTDRSLNQLKRLKAWKDVQHKPSSFRFPNGETLRDVQKRGVDAIESLAAQHRKANICCVSHADVIRLIFAHYMGVHIDLFQRIVIGPAAISVLGLGDSIPRILSLNQMPVGS
ncbi:MAG: histidine phosphatase family protein [Actinomycetota bacterium]